MEILDRMVRALGPPQALHKVVSGNRTLAAVGRWRHRGACVDLSGAQTFQLVFNVSAAQFVELSWREQSFQGTVSAGSLGIVSPGNPAKVAVAGPADTLQIFLTSDLIKAVTGRPVPVTPPRLHAHEPQLQRAATQALVALGRGRGHGAAELDVLVRRIARRLAQPSAISPVDMRGGLSPGARRRVQALINERLHNHLLRMPTVGELAAAAGLSVHHFSRAFHRTEGETPYARVIACRLQHALALLLQADARVDQVGEETGFSSPSHFISAFKSCMGVTPGALRDAARS